MACCLVLAVPLILAAGTAEPPPTPEAFEKALKAYLDLRQDAIKSVPDISKSSEPEAVAARQKAVAERIRGARKGAKPGDVIVSEVRPLLRQRIDGALSVRPAAQQKEIATGNPAHEGGVHVPITVNASYPAAAPRSNMPPEVLAVLPPLPKQLEYRFVGDHLLLLDVEADLIVDFMTKAGDDPTKKGKTP